MSFECMDGIDTCMHRIYFYLRISTITFKLYNISCSLRIILFPISQINLSNSEVVKLTRKALQNQAFKIYAGSAFSANQFPPLYQSPVHCNHQQTLLVSPNWMQDSVSKNECIKSKFSGKQQILILTFEASSIVR